MVPCLVVTASQVDYHIGVLDHLVHRLRVLQVVALQGQESHSEASMVLLT